MKVRKLTALFIITLTIVVVAVPTLAVAGTTISQANLRDGYNATISTTSPNSLSTIVSIPKGTPLYVTNQNTHWYKTVYSGKIGYVWRQLVNVINREWETVYGTTDMNLKASGSYVTAVQKKLNAVMGTNLTLDGVYGNNTRNVVYAFQKEYNLTVDGIVGPKTKAALYSSK